MSAATTDFDNNAAPGLIVRWILGALTAADYALTAKDAYDIVNAGLACDNGSVAACEEVEKLSTQFAIENGVALGIGKIAPGDKVGMKIVGAIRKRGDEQAIEGAERALKENVAANTGTGRFATVQPKDANEAQFLANAEATFGSSATWNGVTRHGDELVIQRSDIPLSQQNITRMKNGQAPFIQRPDGSWESIQLHHVGRETGKMIEVTRSQNRYNSATGGPLHIPGPGGPVRQPGYSQSYWQQRYQDFVSSGQITP